MSRHKCFLRALPTKTSFGVPEPSLYSYGTRLYVKRNGLEGTKTPNGIKIRGVFFSIEDKYLSLEDPGVTIEKTPRKLGSPYQFGNIVAMVGGRGTGVITRLWKYDDGWRYEVVTHRRTVTVGEAKIEILRKGCAFSKTLVKSATFAHEYEKNTVPTEQGDGQTPGCQERFAAKAKSGGDSDPSNEGRS